MIGCRRFSIKEERAGNRIEQRQCRFFSFFFDTVHHGNDLVAVGKDNAFDVQREGIIAVGKGAGIRNAQTLAPVQDGEFVVQSGNARILSECGKI